GGAGPPLRERDARIRTALACRRILPPLPAHCWTKHARHRHRRPCSSLWSLPAVCRSSMRCVSRVIDYVGHADCLLQCDRRKHGSRHGHCAGIPAGVLLEPDVRLDVLATLVPARRIIRNCWALSLATFDARLAAGGRGGIPLEPRNGAPPEDGRACRRGGCRDDTTLVAATRRLASRLRALVGCPVSRDVALDSAVVC